MNNTVIVVIIVLVVLIRLVNTFFKNSLKTDESSNEEQGDFKPEPSPWDDLIRTIRNENTDDTKTQVSDYNNNEVEEYTFGNYDTDQPISKNEEYFTYEAPVYNYDNNINTMIETQPELQQNAEALQIASEVKAISGTVSKPVFKGDFDPRMAIIYSEIMNPKYID